MPANAAFPGMQGPGFLTAKRSLNSLFALVNQWFSNRDRSPAMTCGRTPDRSFFSKRPGNSRYDILFRKKSNEMQRDAPADQAKLPDNS